MADEPADAADGRLDPAALGGLSSQPNNTLWLVAHGDPVTQGSMRAVAAGVALHNKSKELHAWRNTITVEALRACTTAWEQVGCPVQLDAIFTVKRPKTISNKRGVISGGGRRIPPAVKPDVDKLLRAVQDALSPHQKRDGQRFRILDEDSRIIGGSQYKTYPRPFHTHPWALDRPGVVIRLSPIGTCDPAPTSTLACPGELPEEATTLHNRALARAS